MADKNNKTTNPCARCIWRMCGNERVIRGSASGPNIKSAPADVGLTSGR